ncbi:hypothetical protein C900_02928 [Fulvivirga imtechensis AK7]|uniref:ApeI dehydratase-like domain-containing protein n=1 Tax=Fulvivirga imtechensis AK7 TaxID=1237149 RepID=L8JSZ9_9BACT|nr:hypothetical protein [Fulvivirga imtechensis]ELR71313.1 hypothetical protein C900_02928 [Fulvivirga imtechensis AK7]
MLKDSLYTIGNIQEKGDGEYFVAVQLNESHPVFEGHFPGQPVLPGVCLLEMLKDMVNEVKNGTYRMHESSMIKYLQMVNPKENSTLAFQFTLSPAESGFRVTASSTLADGATNFKFKGSFIPAQP